MPQSWPRHPTSSRRLLDGRRRRVSRRGFLRGAGLAGLGRRRPRRCSSACGTQAAKQTADSCVSKDLSCDPEDAALLQLAALHRREEGQARRQEGHGLPDAGEVREGHRHQGRLRRRRQRQLRVLRDRAQPARGLQAAPAATSSTLTDWMAARMVDLGWIQKLDKAKIPNVDGQPASTTLKSPSWDKDRDYSVPWQSGLTGIAYNAKLDQGGPQLRRAADPLRPQGQGQPALGDARHDAVHAAARGRRPRGLHRRRVRRRDRPAHRRRSTPARSGPSPATSTPRTSSRATSSPARPGPATSSSSSSTTPTSSSSRRRRDWRLERQHAGARTRRPTRRTPRS